MSPTRQRKRFSANYTEYMCRTADHSSKVRRKSEESMSYAYCSLVSLELITYIQRHGVGGREEGRLEGIDSINYAGGWYLLHVPHFLVTVGQSCVTRYIEIALQNPIVPTVCMAVMPPWKKFSVL